MLRAVLRKIRWVVVALGIIALWRGGASIFDMPENEVVYETRPPFGPCLSDRCIGTYVLEVGNTGKVIQPKLRVRLRSEPLRATVLPLKARAYGKVDRPFAISDNEGVRTIELSNVKPGERVEVSFTLAAAERGSLAAWDDVLVGVEGSAGEVVPGSAAVITFGRWMHRLLGIW
jgi:hypothetical protein